MNILFIMADQLAARSLGCYGSGVDSTPTLDRLARDGVRFDRCYTTFPVCAPNRATILTGRSPAVHGVITNNYALATDTPTYAHVLQSHGYRTGGFGKFHQTPMHCPVPEDVAFLGFDESVVSEDPKWGPWIEWIAGAHPAHLQAALAMCWPSWPSHPRPEASDAAQDARERIIGPLQVASDWYLMHPSPLPPELHDTTYLTDLALGFMQRHLADNGDRPFFCHLSYVDPHDPYDPPEPYASMFDPEDMREPLPAEWLEQGFGTLRRSQDFHQFSEIFDKPGVMRKLRALYHGSLRLIDDQIARLVGFLREKDLWEDTVVVFTTDHGDMLGDHGLNFKGVMHYDMCIRCPLVVAGGGIGPAVSERLTCMLDFFPTFCDWAGVGESVRPPLEGRSFASTCAGQDERDSWREVSVAVGSVESVVTDDGWRLTRFLNDDKGQMFDLRDDPGEQRNLYDDAAYAGKRQELLERLVRASARHKRVPHYRNMPVIDGVKVPIHTDQMGGGLPLYRNPPSPALDERARAGSSKEQQAGQHRQEGA